MSTILHTYMHARTQPERRERSRTALLGAAARGISRNGYANLNLEQVARDAGYTRGALYHQFRDKDELGLATLACVNRARRVLATLEGFNRGGKDSVAPSVEAVEKPLDKLRVLARGHALFCRSDTARLEIALRIEFPDDAHPIGAELARISDGLIRRLVRLVNEGRREGSIPPGPPARVTALALIGALEGTVIALAGQAPHDVALAERAVLGVLGL